MTNLHTQQVHTNNRSYFFDIKKTKKGASYLNINIAQKDKSGKYTKNKITIYENDMAAFSTALMRSLILFKATGREAHIAQVRQNFPNAFQPWSKEDDHLLEIEFAAETDYEELSTLLGRTKEAIHARIIKLRLEEKYVF